MKFKEGKWNSYSSNEFQRRYNENILNFSKEWAERMEISIDSIGLETTMLNHERFSIESKRKYNVYGFNYATALSLLGECWIHGEELKNSHDNLFKKYCALEQEEPTVFIVWNGEKN